MAQRIEAVVTMKGIYKYTAPAYGYGYEDRYIYTMEAEDGTVYVWKTGTFMGYEVEDPNGWIHREKKGQEVIYRFDNINKGDVIAIKATVKGYGEYKGHPQTELTRVKVVERTFKAKTPDEIRAEKEADKEKRKKEQKESIGENDIVQRMPYRQYKEHYNDCETVIGSFDCVRGHAYIEVIIREGRLVNSGVRGQHFHGFTIQFTLNGKTVHTTYRAVCEENAIKRAKRNYPGATDIECVKVYM